jgi:SAM-dependent methyltransferase
VHDERRGRHLSFWRGVELCDEVCAARVRAGALWVEVGCGPGHLAARLAARGARVVGFDLDPRMASYARRRWQGERGAFGVAAGDACRLPLADGSCAGIVAVSLLGYLHQPAAFFAEAARALAPGGTLCVTAMNRHSLLLRGSGALAWPARRTAPRYAAHDAAVLIAALRAVELEPQAQHDYGHFLALGPLVVPGATLARRLERSVEPGRRGVLARQILLVAQRRHGAVTAS